MGSLPVEQATMYKDEEERELMRNASRINDACMDMVIHAVHEGATERELSTKVENFFKEHGCNSLGFSMVGMGKNGADPHHDADSTVLQPGDSIVLDIGAPFGHYLRGDISPRTISTARSAKNSARSMKRSAVQTKLPSPSSNRALPSRNLTWQRARSSKMPAMENTSPTVPDTASA